MTVADDERFMRRAIDLSQRAALIDCTGGPFGTVITRGGEIIGEGFNQVIAQNDPTWHGEMEAIRHACRHLQSFNLSGCTLYTSAEPCPMCEAAIYWAHIDRVVYAARCTDATDYGDFDDSAIYADLRKPVSERQIPHQELLRLEALAVWRDYQQKSDRVPY